MVIQVVDKVGGGEIDVHLERGEDWRSRWRDRDWDIGSGDSCEKRGADERKRQRSG